MEIEKGRLRSEMEMEMWELRSVGGGDDCRHGRVYNMRRKRTKDGTLGTLTFKRKVGEPGKEKEQRKLRIPAM